MRSSPSASIDLMAYTALVHRRWKIVVAGVLVGIIGGLAYSEAAPKTYTATTAVYVLRTGANQSDQVQGARSGGAIDLNSEAQLVTSAAVAEQAGKLMNSPLTPYQLGRQVSVTVPPNTGVLNINCNARTPALAASCANAFARAYLSNRSSSAATTDSTQLKTLQSEMGSLQRAISRLKGQIPALPKNSVTRLSDRATVDSDKTRVSSLIHQIGELTGQAASTKGGQIITTASTPGKPSDPEKTLVLPSGLVAGLVLGLIAAFVWDRRDKRLHSAQDVERLLGMPVLMDLPRVSAGRQVSLASPRSRAGKAFTELAHGVAASLGEGSHVLLVAGTEPGPAASVVAANLAATLARTHSEAVLVCADLNDSVATELFGLSDKRGLAEVVAGRATVGEVARGPSATPRLWVIPPGADISLAEYHLQYDTAKALTSQLRRDARYVVIEAQATGDETDTLALAEFADAAVLTAETNHTSQDDASACIRRLRRLGTPILGFITLPPLGPNATFTPPQAAPQLTAAAVSGPDGRTRSNR